MVAVVVCMCLCVQAHGHITIRHARRVSITTRKFSVNKCLNRSDITWLIRADICIVEQFVFYESHDLLWCCIKWWITAEFDCVYAAWRSRSLSVCVTGCVCLCIDFCTFTVPSGETTVLDVAFRICRPLTIHFISAGGFEGAVVHCSGTMSPTLASVAPVIETWVGATDGRQQQKFRCI